MSTVDALQEIIPYVGTCAAAPLPQISKLHEEDDVAEECGSTSLSDICASQASNVNDEVCLIDLANPHEEYEHVGVDEEDQYSFDSVGSDSHDELRKKKDIPNSEQVEDSSDDEEWVTEDARRDVIPEIVYDKENPSMHVGAKHPNIEEFRDGNLSLLMHD
ncbi:hypothetical protein D1007_30916 [Hordeum vulgare]|nr:hypothetical protein D1007_30916 [Hordeum vulgare]